MKEFSPYHITHVHLHESLQMPDLKQENQGNYLVFWWHSVALGELYVEPNENITHEQYFQKLGKALKPALDFYASGQRTAGLEQLLPSGDFHGFVSAMESLFAKSASQTIPSRVPVSVVICTRNRPVALKRCLESLRQSICQPAEIIIIENARENDETEKLVETFAGVKYFQEPVPGLSHARNTGVKKATHSIIAFTDDDVIVHPEWVFRVWEAFTKHEVAAMTGLVIAAELETETQLIFERCWSFNRGYVDILYEENYFNQNLPSGPPVWEIGAGANMAFRKEVFEEIGLFDVRLGAGASGCSEDSEVWYRILQHQHSILYYPKAAVFHAHRKDLRSLRKQIFAYMRGFTMAVLVQQDHFPAANYRNRLFRQYPKHYLQLVARGFPRYRFRNRTLWEEIMGILSGYAFYLKNRKNDPKTQFVREEPAPQLKPEQELTT
ncbi:glycosyltransferase family 2 protein [Rufibacter hautae]|uniref:Glycosyltransferase family 2 protein n=1 Tax=Rufibacter hautae TaxID=2595005 RepID=A0A5B6TCP5_9BACT|nr:glycosyltransferase family A protein [Rufibacter hautae]KAA3436794.1 glycosyltransferase family 2 protein [Rufibacter hautae]